MLKQVNSAQALAIEHAFGPVQVLAGPGSGKTLTTIRRIRHLICHHGISPDKILVITFTKAAAAEMEQRFLSLTKGAYKEVVFGTFHSVYFQILKQSEYMTGKLSLASPSDKIRYLTHILKMQGVHETDRESMELLLETIGKIKNKQPKKNGRNASDDKKNTSGNRKTIPNNKKADVKYERIETEHEEYVEIKGGENPIEINTAVVYMEYCQLMREENKLDFDDMILLCDKLLEENKAVLAFWQQRFSHILVDEFQDIGNLQYRVVKRLAQPEDNLFVVGDDDQSIYGFRGAGPHIMKQFLEDYPEAIQITLDTNYRSTKNIVDAASLLISDNKNRLVKELKAAGEKGEKVSILSFSTREEEYNHLIISLKELSAKELSHTAVIFRSNAQAAALAKVLSKEKIPFYIKSHMKNIFEQEPAKDILAYLRFANDCCHGKEGQGERKDLLRIMNKPCRYIHRSALTEERVSKKMLLDYYNENSCMQEIINRLFTNLEKTASLSPYAAINYIRKIIGYDKCMPKTTEILDEIQRTAKGYKRLEDWLCYISEYSESMMRINSKNSKNSGIPKSESEAAVKLITMHASKGLQYSTVFLPDISQSVIPGRKAVTQELIEEERRLLYVAMTRAEHKLLILYYGKPSPFIEKLLKRLS